MSIKEKRFIVMDDQGHIYFNEFGNEEEVMDYDSAKYLAEALNGSQPFCKVMELVEVNDHCKQTA